MGQCKCGHTRNAEKNCDGTHKVVKAVKEQIAQKIEAIEFGEENNQLNAVGMKIMALKAIRE